MDAQFATEMAAAEVAISSPTKRDKAKRLAWLGLAARLPKSVDGGKP